MESNSPAKFKLKLIPMRSALAPTFQAINRVPRPTMTSEYIFSGSLPENASTYVKRQADSDLYDALTAGKFCYVLNSRQTGKSSLRVRTMRRLREEGIACAAIDLSFGGTQYVTMEQWYVDMLDTLTESFGLDVDLEDWWEERELLSPLRRFRRFIQEILLVEVPGNIVIFIDEIDSILSLNFPTDDFFAFIRACYNQRADNPEYNRLTFCLLGVASPTDLIEDKKRTPFNIGTAIELKGFDLHEVKPLVKGLEGKVDNPLKALKEILVWTGGQPFLTQKLCYLIAKRSEKNNLKMEQFVQNCIIENWEAQDEPEHLRTIRDRLLVNDERAGRLLPLYKQVLQQSELEADNSQEQMELRITGLVVRHEGKLRTYNRIYEQVFNRDWIEQAYKGLRPYTEALNAWIASGKDDESRLLRGRALREALEWSEGKKISDRDREFLSSSQKLDRRYVIHKWLSEATFFILVLLSLFVPIQDFLIDRRVLVQAIYRQLTGQIFKTPTPPILLVSIDEESIRKAAIVSPNPMDRGYLARLIDKLSELDAKTIGIDYLLNRPHGESDRVLAQSVQAAVQKQPHPTTFVFVSLRDPIAGWLDVLPEIARPTWSLQGHVHFAEWNVPLIPQNAFSDEQFPLPYLLALAHRVNPDPTTQPQLKSEEDFFAQITQNLKSQEQDYRTLFSWRSQRQPLTTFSYKLRQLWLHPIIDFSIPPSQVYERVPAWKLLDGTVPHDLLEQVVIIAPGDYELAQFNFPLPPAVSYWLRQPTDPLLSYRLTGGEIHAYTTHHYLTRRFVIPIPDLWLIVLAALVEKGVVLIIELRNDGIRKDQQKFSRFQLPSRKGKWVLLISATAIYGLASLQLYISAGVLIPWFFPSLMLWIYILLRLKGKLG